MNCSDYTFCEVNASRMNIASFLQQEKDRNAKIQQLVKDFSVFDFSYIPDEPIMREESKYLIKELTRFDISSIPTHLAVIGAKGSGKTLTLKYLQGLLNNEGRINVIYANCREHNTTFKIFAHLLGVQARGASLSELYDKFCHEHPGKTVVLLDEIDLMSAKDKNREILYLLSRSKNPYMVIMLSNNYRFLRDLDLSTKSTLQPVSVYFKNYDAAQIHKILIQRAQQGLNKWDGAKLSQIAALTTKKTNSDTRVAIKTLFYSVTKDSDDVEICFEKARKDIVFDMIHDLSDPNLMILQAVAASKSDFAKEIYQRYRKISSLHNEVPFSYVYFYANLSCLQSMGLVALIATKVGRTYANRVMLTFENQVLETVCRLKLDS
jgi:cell division control protein 6